MDYVGRFQRFNRIFDVITHQNNSPKFIIINTKLNINQITHLVVGKCWARLNANERFHVFEMNLLLRLSLWTGFFQGGHGNWNYIWLFLCFFSIANLAIPIRIASCAMRLSAHGISFMWAVISRCRRRGFNFKVYFYRSIFRSQLVFSRGANTCFELSMQLYSNTVTSHKAQYIVMQMLLFSVHKFVIYIQVNLNVTRYCIMLNFV